MAEIGVVRHEGMRWSRRRVSVSVGLRYAALAAAAVALAAVHVRRPATVCLLRATTGVPCPLCGGTTAVVRLGHGDGAGALRASPLAVAMVASLPLVGRVRPPAWWGAAAPRRSAIAAVLIASEAWQLLRLGVVHL